MINYIFWVVFIIVLLPTLLEKNFFILMFLPHLTLKNYYGKIYQALILFQYTVVLRTLQVVQIIVHYSYMEDIYLMLQRQRHWFIHLIHKANHGVLQQ